MAIDGLESLCTCPTDTEIQALVKIVNNFNKIFLAMASDYEGQVVSLIGPNGCGCTRDQIMAAFNANLIEFGRVYTGGGGSAISFGIGSPSGGSNGDVYIQTDTGEVWEKDSGVWAVQTEFSMPADFGSIAALVAPQTLNLSAVTAVPNGPAPFQYNYFKVLSGNLTLTEGGSNVEGNGYTLVLIGDASPRTITFPSSYSEAQGANITSFVMAANTQYTIVRRYVNGGWRIYGDPAPSSANWATGILFTYGSTSPQISNSVTKTEVFSGTIPASTLNGNGSVIGAVRFMLHGTITQTTGSAQLLTVEITYGGSVMYSDALATGAIASSGTARMFRIDGILYGEGTDAQRMEATMMVGPADAASTGYGGLGGSGIIGNQPMGGTATADQDVDQTLAINITLGAASSSYTWTTLRGLAAKL